MREVPAAGVFTGVVVNVLSWICRAVNSRQFARPSRQSRSARALKDRSSSCSRGKVWNIFPGRVAIWLSLSTSFCREGVHRGQGLLPGWCSHWLRLVRRLRFRRRFFSSGSRSGWGTTSRRFSLSRRVCSMPLADSASPHTVAIWLLLRFKWLSTGRPFKQLSATLLSLFRLSSSRCRLGQCSWGSSLIWLEFTHSTVSCVSPLRGEISAIRLESRCRYLSCCRPRRGDSDVILLSFALILTRFNKPATPCSSVSLFTFRESLVRFLNLSRKVELQRPSTQKSSSLASSGSVSRSTMELLRASSFSRSAFADTTLSLDFPPLLVVLILWSLLEELGRRLPALWSNKEPEEARLAHQSRQHRSAQITAGTNSQDPSWSLQTASWCWELFDGANNASIVLRARSAPSAEYCIFKLSCLSTSSAASSLIEYGKGRLATTSSSCDKAETVSHIPSASLPILSWCCMSGAWLTVVAEAVGLFHAAVLMLPPHFFPCVGSTATTALAPRGAGVRVGGCVGLLGGGAAVLRCSWTDRPVPGSISALLSTSDDCTGIAAATAERLLECCEPTQTVVLSSCSSSSKQSSSLLSLP